MKKSRIGIIAALSVCMVLALATILLAVIPINHKIELTSKSPDSIQFSTFPLSLTSTDGEKYQDVVDAYDKMFSTTILSGIFSGTLSSYSITEPLSKPALNGIVVTFNFETPQNLMKDGKVYNNRYYDIPFTFTKLEFVIAKDNAYQPIKMIAEMDVQKQDEPNEFIKMYAEISSMANTSIMYELIKDYVE